ncbi:MAG TPA: alpha/beta fold hydrolase [Gemmatales bacterium]|nr:alpha/beta fold hydrolase [Gemmatales bacterium]HMP61157.1 alpha/beta fold hydrolase [Gemmatales bacterium]
MSSYTARYQVFGQGRPLVLIPGLAGGIGLATPLAIQLAQHGFQVFTYQLRGEDDCFDLRRRFGMSDLVDDLHEFLADMCLEQPLLMGVSFGGQIALSYAARHARRLAGVATQGINVRFERSLLRQVAGHVLSRYPLPSDSPFVNQFFNLLYGGRPTCKLTAEFVTRLCWQTDQSVMAHRFRLAEQTDLAPVLPSLQLPSLLVRGERDMLVSEKGQDEVARAVPHAVIKEIPTAGHLAFVTHADSLARLVARFAAQLAD